MLKVKMEYSDLDANETTIRGIPCVKEQLVSKLRISKDTKELVNPVFYWRPTFEKNSTFYRGLELVEKGLGFPKDKNNLLTLLKKASKRNK